MNKEFVKKILVSVGINVKVLRERISSWSINLALAEQKLDTLVQRLRTIVPDVSNQRSYNEEFNKYSELKRRGQHAFQCSVMLKSIEDAPSGRLTVVDIGDSAGTHMFYLKGLVKDQFEIDAISVNLDPVAIEKIEKAGLNAILCRAEDLNLGNQQIDLFTSFEMLEHLHNPAIFLRRLAKKSKGRRVVVTVPYCKTSRVGLYYIRNNSTTAISAEREHIFEFSPQDWLLLMLHSGWKAVSSQIYYQYPRRLLILSKLLAWYWRKTDFEGFWGVILEKDLNFSDCYQDWEE